MFDLDTTPEPARARAWAASNGGTLPGRARGGLGVARALCTLLIAGVLSAAAAQSAEIHDVSFNTEHDPDGIWIHVDFTVADLNAPVKVLAWVRYADGGGYVPNRDGDADYQDADDDLLTADVQAVGERGEPFWLYVPYDQFPEGRNLYWLHVSVRPDGSSESLATRRLEERTFEIAYDGGGRDVFVVEEIEQDGVFGDSGENRPFSFTFAESNLGARRVYAEALITGGINENPQITSAMGSWVYGKAGRYRLSADAYWSGYLSGAGIAGAGASVVYVVKIYDSDQTPIAVHPIHENEVQESFVTIGGLHDEGDETVIFEFEVTDDEGFFVSFELTCEASAGLAALDVYCLFGTGLSDDHEVLAGYAGVSRLELTRIR